MLDVKILRDNPEQIAKLLSARGYKFPQEDFAQLEAQRKELQIKTESLQQARNSASKEIGLKKARGEDCSVILQEVNNINTNLQSCSAQLEQIQAELNKILHRIPNVPHQSVPIGASEADNVEVRRHLEPKTISYAKDHVTLMQQGLDLARASKLSGSRFAVLHGKFATLHRALGQFMLDLHIKQHGYEEVYIPYLVQSSTLFGTGQLPKMAEDLFAIKDHDLWLIPTSEVAVTNLYRDNIWEIKDLPKKYVCHSPCFRSEAGSYSKDLTGMFRQHQFDKVELVQFSYPEHSYTILEEMVGHAEEVLKQLRLPYRVMALCTADLGFAAAKTYDLEVWLPGQNKYREISSCSNVEAFQARRMQARYRDKEKKIDYLHTLNGSGVAVGRALIAIIENYQTSTGAIEIPEALWPYTGFKEISNP